ncbi:hypothetical protein T07_9643, partial [Trichinella nelsoni]
LRLLACHGYFYISVAVCRSPFSLTRNVIAHAEHDCLALNFPIARRSLF